MASRPPEVTGATDYENPQSLDKILKALGATSIDWPYKTDCCGAGLTISRADVGFAMVGKILDMARRTGAQAVVVSCQMCQANLDLYQERIEAERNTYFGLPIIYFTELIGLSMGLPGASEWLSRHFVDPISLLRRYRLV
jgi:heterodisulfide reductase subunit B